MSENYYGDDDCTVLMWAKMGIVTVMLKLILPVILMVQFRTMLIIKVNGKKVSILLVLLIK